jgi:primosomal protein N' (replication factor Y)
MICEVYLFDVPYHIDKTFDYLAPENAEIGNIVKVPFGKGDTLRFGVIFKFKEQSSEQNVKPVHSVLGDRVSLNEEMLGLCLFLKEHTLCTFGEAARTVLPPGALSEKLNVKYRKRCELLIKRSEAAEIL